MDVCTHLWCTHATSESATKRAALLSDMHLRNLRQKLQLKQRMDEISKKLEVCCDVSFLDIFEILIIILSGKSATLICRLF